MSPERREILERVATGELSAEEAEALLRSLDAQSASPAAAPESESRTQIRKIKVAVGVGGIDIIGDPTVAQADIDGPHQAEVDGDTLVIRGELDPQRPGAFSISMDSGKTIRINRNTAWSIARSTLGDRSSHGFDKVSRLSIRMNPELELDVQLDAGPLSITGMNGPIRARLAAGPITVEQFKGPLDLSVNAGAIRAVGTLTHGESRVRSDAGAVRIVLDPASSVHVVAHAALGKVVVPGAEPRKSRFGSDRQEATIGDGEASLRVETAMGSVHVTTG